MNKLFMKIHSFEKSGGSLLVSFASDVTASQNPDDYPQVAFQPVTMWPDIDNPEEIKKRIAVAGVWNAEQQARQEQMKQDAAMQAQYEAMVGQVVEYPVADLENPYQPEIVSALVTV